MHFAREIVFGRQSHAAVQTHPRAEQRVGIAVPFLPGRHQVDIFKPGQVVLGRSGRPPQPLRDFCQRQSFFFAQNLENRLQCAVAAGPMEAQLVREMTEFGEPALGVHQRGEGPEGITGRRPAPGLPAHPYVLSRRVLSGKSCRAGGEHRAPASD